MPSACKNLLSWLQLGPVFHSGLSYQTHIFLLPPTTTSAKKEWSILFARKDGPVLEFLKINEEQSVDILVHKTHILLTSADPAFLEVDALIHPTNNYLWFASGFSERLKQRGGEELEVDSIALGPIEVGQACLVPAGRLKSRFIIHAAAWGQDMMTNKKKIRQALNAALALAAKNGCVSIALPVVGAGVGGFNLAAAIEATFFTLIEHCMQTTPLQRILFLASNPAEEKILGQLFSFARSAVPPPSGYGSAPA